VYTKKLLSDKSVPRDLCMCWQNGHMVPSLVPKFDRFGLILLEITHYSTWSLKWF